MSPDEIQNSLRGRTTAFKDEILLHEQMEAAFLRAGFSFRREVNVKGGRLDFLFDDGTALEVKVKGSGNSVSRQAARYCDLEEIMKVIIVSTRPMTLPLSGDYISPSGKTKRIELVELWKNAL